MIFPLFSLFVVLIVGVVVVVTTENNVFSKMGKFYVASVVLVSLGCVPFEHKMEN
jgi:hypothetical protein